MFNVEPLNFMCDGFKEYLELDLIYVLALIHITHTYTQIVSIEGAYFIENSFVQKLANIFLVILFQSPGVPSAISCSNN